MRLIQSWVFMKSQKKWGSAEGAAPLTEISQPFNMDTLRNKLAPTQQPVEPPLGEVPSHRLHARPFLDVTNRSHAPSIVKPSSQTKWKRIIQEFSGKTSTLEDQIGLKRPSDMVRDICESPCKKLLVSNEDKEKYPILAEAGSQPCQAQ